MAGSGYVSTATGSVAAEGGMTVDELAGRLMLAVNALAERRALAGAFGQTAYGGIRDYYTVLGYTTALNYADYYARYERQDIARRIVDLPAIDTWRRPPPVTEDGEEDTEFVQAWADLSDRARVWSHLQRIDRISGIGRYGVLYIGLADGGEPAEPVNAGAIDGPDDLLFLRQFSEDNARVEETDEDPQSARYGLPTLYELKVEGGEKMRVHWTRCLHVADNRLDSEVYGTPRLQIVFNRLDDLVKVVGGAAEATWLNMRPGTLLTTKDGYDWPDDDDSRTTLQHEIEEYLHGLARMMTVEGADLKQIAGQVVDPGGPFETIIALISAASGIPQRVLLGSAAGELAAAQEDARQWYGTIASRQQNYAEPDILRAFIDRLIEFGVLPAPASGAYDVGVQTADGDWAWPALHNLTDEERATVTLSRAQAVVALADRGAKLPLTLEEVRALLGHPGEVPEELVPDEEPVVEAPPVPPPAEGGEADEADGVDEVMRQVAANYLAGTVTDEQLLEVALFAAVERRRDGDGG